MSFVVKSDTPTNIAGVKFDNLGEKLKGQTIGSTVDLEGDIPADLPDEKLRGKHVKIALAIKGVKHQHLPEVNKEFAEMLGFDEVDALKTDLKERLVTQLEQETKGAMAQQVYRYLLSNTKLDLPSKLSQRQMGNVLRRRATELMQRGMPEQEIVQQIDQLRISSAQQAAVDLRLFFIMSKLAEQFGIEVSEEEVNARIAAIAMQYGRRPEKLKGQMSASGQLEQLHLQDPRHEGRRQAGRDGPGERGGRKDAGRGIQESSAAVEYRPHRHGCLAFGQAGREEVRSTQVANHARKTVRQHWPYFGARHGRFFCGAAQAGLSGTIDAAHCGAERRAFCPGHPG